MCKADILRIPDYLEHNIELHHAKFSAAHPEIPWEVVYAMRNRVAHGYFKVDLEMVWKTIHSDLLELHAQIKQLLDKIR